MAPKTTHASMAEKARIREASKDEVERGEDVVYIVNHAAACSLFDGLNTPIELWSQKHFGVKISVSHCPGCASGEHDPRNFGADHETLTKRAGRWLAAEYIGDWGAAFPTLMVQRHAPFVMEAIGRGLTYLAGDYFYAGAKRSAERWGAKHGFGKESEEVQGRTKEIYTHEMKHIAQAFVWTGFSSAIALGTLSAMGDPNPWHVNLSAKLVGVSTSFLTLLGARAAMPEVANRWDHWGSEHIVTPLTKLISKTIGIEGDTVDKALAKQSDYRDGTSWLHKERGREDDARNTGWALQPA